MSLQIQTHSRIFEIQFNLTQFLFSVSLRFILLSLLRLNQNCFLIQAHLSSLVLISPLSQLAIIIISFSLSLLRERISQVHRLYFYLRFSHPYCSDRGSQSYIIISAPTGFALIKLIFLSTTTSSITRLEGRTIPAVPTASQLLSNIYISQHTFHCLRTLLQPSPIHLNYQTQRELTLP